MVPGKYDITIYQGGTFGFDSAGTDAAGAIDYLATYDKALMQIRAPWVKKAGVNLPLFELSTENGRITLTNTSVGVSISANDTSNITFNAGVYSLKLIINGLTASDDIVDILLYGNVKVIGDVTL